MSVALGLPLVLGALGRLTPVVGNLLFFVALLLAAWSWLLHSVDARASVSLFKDAEIEVHDDHFVVQTDDRERRYDKRDVEHVFTFQKLGLNVIVRLAKGGELIIKAADERQAERLVASLQSDPARHTARVPIAPRAHRSRGAKRFARAAFALSWLVSVAASTALASGAVSWFVIGCLAMLITALPLLRRTAVVGTDGVRIDSVLTKRFIPHAELDTAAIPRVALGGGARRPYPAGAPSTWSRRSKHRRAPRATRSLDERLDRSAPRPHAIGLSRGAGAHRGSGRSRQ